jgi:hypothetical protein
MMDHHPPIRAGFDVLAGMTVLGSLAGMLPAISALLAIVYYLIQIYFAVKHGPKQKGSNPPPSGE